jgi:hypothetical protein
VKVPVKESPLTWLSVYSITAALAPMDRVRKIKASNLLIMLETPRVSKPLERK